MKEYKQGFIALISILIISATVLLISIGVSLRSVGESNMSLNESLSNYSLSLADACAEDALLKLFSDFNYSGNETIIIGSDSCNILPVEGSGNFNRVIKTESNFKNYRKKIKINIAQVRPLQISLWQEVPNF
ncbi:MAG: hypothetical protein AB1643_02855 [Patescibacteria group bacterium]